MCSTSSISSSIFPEGVMTSTISPSFLPIIAFAIGVSIEIYPLDGSDSRLPTILYFNSLSSAKLKSFTAEPKITSPC